MKSLTVGWLLKILAAILCGLVLVGLVFEQLGRRRDGMLMPQIGRSIDIGGRKLNIHCLGEPGPTVILEAPGNEPGYVWTVIQDRVAEFSRVCWWDRSGVGWSDPGPYPRTSKAIATDLHALLSAAGIPPPYVLVGYSFGGHNVRVYNGLYPNEVAGMVLVDAASEEEYQRIGPWGRGKRVANWLRYPLYMATKFLVQTGVVRLTTAGGEPVPIPGWTPLQNGILATLHKRPEAVAAGMSTALFSDENDRQAHDAGGLGDKPLIVLTAGKMLEMPREIAAEAGAYHEIWMHELQPKLARLSTRGRQVIVPDATHELGSTTPGVVVDAVREVVETVRREHR